MKTWCVWVACAVLGGCESGAYTNKALKTHGAPPPPSGASFDIKPRGNERVMVLLALSGGGSRAAYFSGKVMLDLQQAGLLEEVDAISSVSGGSLAGAYYCTTRDEGDPAEVAPRVWSEAEVKQLMSRNYLAHWIANQFWPVNIVRYWCTAFDRSDIMAQTLADNLFDHPVTGGDLTLGELNPARPALILNATNATRNPSGASADAFTAAAPKQYGSVFTFTREDFTDRLGSDVNRYSVARAVMASATFPGVFQDMTLRDFRTGRQRYMHVFDGGNSDNLGLLSVKRVIRNAESWPEERRPERYVVISVDAYTRPDGVDPDDADPRSRLDRFVDSNFMDSIDALLTVSRWGVLSQFIRDEGEQRRLREQQRQDSPAQQATSAAAKSVDDETWKALQQRDVPSPSPVLPPEAGLAEGGAGEDAGAGAADVPPPEADVADAGESGRQPRPAAHLGEDWEPIDLDEDRLLFWHIEFADLQATDGKLCRAVNSIPTDFRLPEGATALLDAAADALVTANTAKLAQVRAALGLGAR